MMKRVTARKYKRFTKEERSTFSYWFWHWLAFNDMAREFGVWKFKYLFHDMEKPFLKLFLPYKKVQKLHRKHNRHHLEYRKPEKRDWDAMVIDWECSRFTKEHCPRDSEQEAFAKYSCGEMSSNEYLSFMNAHNRLFRKRRLCLY